MSLVKSYDDLLYISKTCNKAMKRKFIPCQAVSNKLDITFFAKGIWKYTQTRKGACIKKYTV